MSITPEPTHAPTHETVYKICPTPVWETARQSGIYAGSPHDARDGFIHFSYAHQLAETARKHFAGQVDLVVLEVPRRLLGEALRDEPSRGGDLFPHLYGQLQTSLVTAVWELPWDGERHAFPAAFGR